jgi:VWFA-related protein
VTPKSGPPVSGLQQQDFTLLDNKVPQNIASFQAVEGSQAAVNVIVLIDAVNADYYTVAYERGEIDKFLRADGGHLAYPTKLVFLTDSGTQIQLGFSTDGNSLSASLDRQTVGLRSIKPSGEYGGAERFQLCLEEMHQVVSKEAGRPGRKIILCISPGWPLVVPGQLDGQLDAKQQQSIFANIVGFSTELMQNRITLYSIDPSGVGSVGLHTFYWKSFEKAVGKPNEGDLALQVLATQSGGMALGPSNDITALLQKSIADAESYYEISFDSPTDGRPNQYHYLEIRIARPGLTARTRQGYYSNPDLSWDNKPPTPVEAGGGARREHR